MKNLTTALLIAFGVCFSAGSVRAENLVDDVGDRTESRYQQIARSFEKASPTLSMGLIGTWQLKTKTNKGPNGAVSEIPAGVELLHFYLRYNSVVLESKMYGDSFVVIDQCKGGVCYLPKGETTATFVNSCRLMINGDLICKSFFWHKPEDVTLQSYSIYQKLELDPHPIPPTSHFGQWECTMNDGLIGFFVGTGQTKNQAKSAVLSKCERVHGAVCGLFGANCERI